MTPGTKTYLGDGVYVSRALDGGLTLTTEDGISTTNVIHLEPEVLMALVRLVERMVEE